MSGIHMDAAGTNAERVFLAHCSTKAAVLALAEVERHLRSAGNKASARDVRGYRQHLEQYSRDLRALALRHLRSKP